nr:MAG TPA: hypothetical protein [Caudoviricetes sp.]
MIVFSSKVFPKFHSCKTAIYYTKICKTVMWMPYLSGVFVPSNLL